MKNLNNRTLIMGILNITPDSFSDGGKYNTPKKAIARAKQMLDEGANYIDIGGESTRRFSPFKYNRTQIISTEEELKRVLPVITEIKKHLGTEVRLSIDTWKAKVAQEALIAGVHAVNSLGGFLFDENLAGIIARYKCMVIIYHTNDNHDKNADISKEVYNFFEKQIMFGERHGIKRDQFILDPGIGFGKTVGQNLEIIKRLDEFKAFNLPITVGISRKSHLGKILSDNLELKETPPPGQRLEAALAETAIAVLKGASIIRTHDVSSTKKFLTVLDMLKYSM